MKILYIAFKDITQSFRSFLAIAMMFLVPILITGMFALLFGGGGDDDTATIELPVTPVQIVNLDQGELGKILVDLISSENFTELLAVTTAESADAARSAVDDQLADAAVIIPADLSASLYTPGAQSEIEIYQDPTLTLGPGIVTTIITQFSDGFSGSTIAVEVVSQQLTEAGITLSREQIMEIITQYQLVFEDYTTQQDALRIEAPSGEARTNQGVAGILSMVMGGMMIFYAFFTATNAANSLLTEEENLTLGRMLTTATSPVEIVTGKLVAAAMMVFVQIIVLLAFGHLAFGIDWGKPWMLGLFVIAITLGAVTFGLFAISWAKDRKQASLIVGAGVTITGMLGMSSIFMLNSPNPSQTINTLSLLVPQGWANQALIHIMDGFSTPDALISLLGLLVYSLVMFTIGYKRFMKRFA
ncbi:MAG: ABC transporter permease [Chloroflexota bacterium]